VSTSEAALHAPKSKVWPSIATYIWPMALSVYSITWFVWLAMELEYLPEEIAGLTWLLEPGFSIKALFTLVLWFAVGSIPVQDRGHAGKPMKHNLSKWDGYRAFLAFFFFLLSWVVAQGMVPLPDEPPRIQFTGVFCTVSGLVIAFHCLISRSRMALRLTWVFVIWFAFPQLEKRLKFLEMMLEPTLLVKVTYFSLGFVMITLLLPRALQTFDRLGLAMEDDEPRIFNKGFPF
jgi:hypothetical protein